MGQVCATKVCPPEDSATQAAPAEVTEGEISAAQIGSLQVDVQESGATQNDPLEVASPCSVLVDQLIGVDVTRSCLLRRSGWEIPFRATTLSTNRIA